VGDVETVAGDVTDASAVEKAIDGCDAVVHCASVYSLDSRAGGTIKRTNVTGTDTVLGAAQRAGLDPIVHVSSFVALIGERGTTLTADSPPTTPKGAYFRSKADSDRVARRYQEAGAPVVITYPGSVWGPHDPHLGESCRIATAILKGMFRFSMPGAAAISDVRDVAKLHSAVMESGRGPRRYLALAHNVAARELLEAVAEVTARDLRTTTVPLWILETSTLMVDALQRLLPFRLPLNHQSVYFVGLDHRADDGPTRNEFGLEPRSLNDTVADTIRWMANEGHLSPKLAGSLAP